MWDFMPRARNDVDILLRSPVTQSRRMVFQASTTIMIPTKGFRSSCIHPVRGV
jgi:hypothetical protein